MAPKSLGSQVLFLLMIALSAFINPCFRFVDLFKFYFSYKGLSWALYFVIQADALRKKTRMSIFKFLHTTMTSSDQYQC